LAPSRIQYKKIGFNVSFQLIVVKDNELIDHL